MSETTTTKMLTPVEALTEAGVELSERELNIVAATTAHVRAVTAGDLLEYLAADEAAVNALSDATADKFERYVEMALLQHRLSRILVSALVQDAA